MKPPSPATQGAALPLGSSSDAAGDVLHAGSRERAASRTDRRSELGKRYLASTVAFVLNCPTRQHLACSPPAPQCRLVTAT